MAPSDVTEKNRNIGAQLYGPFCMQLLKKEFGKFTYSRTFGAHKLVHCEPFLGYLYELRRLLSALGSDVRNFFYVFAHFTALNYCSGIFFKSHSYLHEVVRTYFSADFWTFRNF